MALRISFLKVLGDKVTEAVATLGEDASPEDQVSVLRLAFSSLMSADPVATRGQLEALVKRVRAISSSCKSERSNLCCVGEMTNANCSCIYIA